MRVFLTGIPGIGKTTVIRSTLEGLREIHCAGFYTEERRHQGRRIAFKIITLDGEEGTLASIERARAKRPTVGRYTVHVEEFEKLVLPLIDPETTSADLYVIDEIGKMELFSHRFRVKIIDLLAQQSNLLATIAKRGKGFVEEIKERNDIELIEVTRENRDYLPRQIAERILNEIHAF
jgi:nucleoside-triphosphatase